MTREEGGEQLIAGIRLALAGDLPGAVRAFERAYAADPASSEAAENLLEAHIAMGELAKAGSLAAELLAKWPDAPGVLVALAKLREREGRAEDAVQLLRRPTVQITPSSPAYRVYLRALLAAGRFEEALLEANQGMDSLWAAESRFTRAVALLHFGDTPQAMRLLDAIDSRALREVGREWLDRLRANGQAAQIDRLLDEARSSHPEHEALRELAPNVPQATGNRRRAPPGP